MVNRATKLRWRRRIKRGRVAVGDIGIQTEENLERHLFRRLGRLYGVRRFIVTWLALSILLIVAGALQTRGLAEHYLALKPVPGGTYIEGTVGAFTNANPLYASGGVNGAVSRLVFSSILKYDNNNQLIGDLASSWELDETELNYTIKLKENVHWHDGRRLTADDVMFTFQTIQNPDAKSPLIHSWKDITLTKIDDYTVKFTLPNTLSSFPHGLTTGIIPEHLLGDTPPSQLRSVRFNTVEPVGSGPFRWEAVEVKGADREERQEIIGLLANEEYHGEKPKLQRIVLKAFRSEELLIQSFKNQELNALAGINYVPDVLKDMNRLEEINIPLTGQILVFFKNSNPILSDVKVRQALVKSADRLAIIDKLGYPVIPARGPLLSSHVAFDKGIVQQTGLVDEAKALLDQAGWVDNGSGQRVKGDIPLEISLMARNNDEQQLITSLLKEQWAAVGVKLNVELQEETDLQTAVADHAYDALLYGISLGPDPDVFAYWHSSQADPRAPTRLNLSEYNSAKANASLEAGRTRSDPTLRAAKYKPFLEAWVADAPALVLYQPRFLYLTNGRLHNFNPKVLNNSNDRFSSVEQWMIKEAKSLK